MAPQERIIEIDRVRTQIREVGEGPPVLLVNGLGAHMAMWGVLERALDGFHVIEFDAPGTGRSATPLLPRGVSGLARLASGVLDAVGVDRADVLGYSMGGILAQQLAVDAPDRVRRLVLVATSCGLGSVPADLKAMLNLITPLRFMSPAFYQRTIGSLAGGRARHDAQWVAEHGERRLQYAPTMRGYFGQILSLSGWSSLPKLSRIPHPAFVVAGTDDPLSPPANAFLLASGLPNARLLLAPAEGHLMLMDRDSVTHEPIRRFLAAPQLEREPVWRDGRRVGAADVRAAMPSARAQVQPLGGISALARRIWPADRAAVCTPLDTDDDASVG
jgi:pimeloyl-ACP methyl ester carboxylesterase